MLVSMYEIYIPGWYHVYEKSSATWMPAETLTGMEELACWNGNNFIPVTVSRSVSPYSVDKLAVIDAVTILGLGDGICRVQSCTQWIPPWLNEEITSTEECMCSDQECAVQAINDFGRRAPHCSNESTYAVPKHRLEDVSKCLPQICPLFVSGRTATIQIPLRQTRGQLCERGMTEACRRHGMSYVETVLALKGRIQRRRDRNQHVEIRDDGLAISPHAFRRLRRIMSSCGILNRYSFRVLIGKNGKGRRERRRVRLGIQGTSQMECLNVKEINKDVLDIIRKKTEYSFRESRIIRDCIKLTRDTEWFKLTIPNTTIIIEGILICLN